MKQWYALYVLLCSYDVYKQQPTSNKISTEALAPKEWATQPSGHMQYYYYY